MVADPLLCVIDRMMEQGLTCETNHSEVCCLTSVLVGGAKVRECSRTSQAPLRAVLAPSTASDLDKGRCRSTYLLSLSACHECLHVYW